MRFATPLHVLCLGAAACAPDGAYTPPPPDVVVEHCNGVDDDSDGQTDEGHADLDANGRADCLDLVCPPAPAPPTGPVALERACVRAAVAEPWSVERRFALAWPAIADGDDVGVTAGLVAGDLGGQRVIVGTQHLFRRGGKRVEQGALTAWRASDGAELWTQAGWVNEAFAPTLGDADGDGDNEVVVGDVDGRIRALNGDGTEIWRSPLITDGPATGHDPAYWRNRFATIADLEADGRPEVIVEMTVLAGTTGAVARRLSYLGPTTTVRPVTVVDVDQDGTSELLAAGTLFSAKGQPRWGLDDTWPWTVSWSAVVEADGDPGPELVVLQGHFWLIDGDGTLLAEALLPDGALAPCVADFDGDGAQEIAFSSAQGVEMRELDGRVRWSAPLGAGEGFNACIAADLDDDGAAEVLTGGGWSLGIWDGRDGARRWREDAVMGGGSPLFVDVDDDGATEVVVPFDGTGVTPLGPTVVFGHTTGEWPAAPRSWPAWDTDAGGGLRGLPVAARGRPDLEVAVVDACFADCTWGPGALTLQVGNAGDADALGAVLTVARADGATLHRVVVDVPASGRVDVPPLPIAAADAGTDLVVAVDFAGDTCTAEAAVVVVESPCAP